MSATTDAIVDAVRARLDELKPLVDEYHRLEVADRALAAADGAGRTVRPAANATRRNTGARRGRPPGPAGTGRKADALEALRHAGPDGLTVAEVAERLGIQPNYLYRVLPALLEAGEVRKDGPRYIADLPVAR